MKSFAFSFNKIAQSCIMTIFTIVIISRFAHRLISIKPKMGNWMHTISQWYWNHAFTILFIGIALYGINRIGIFFIKRKEKARQRKYAEMERLIKKAERIVYKD